METLITSLSDQLRRKPHSAPLALRDNIIDHWSRRAALLFEYTKISTGENHSSGIITRFTTLRRRAAR